MVGEDTVDDELDKFDGNSRGFKIPWVNNPVAANGDSSSAGVIFRGVYLTHNFFVSDLFSSIHKYVFIANDMEGVSPSNTLFLGSFISCPNTLV